MNKINKQLVPICFLTAIIVFALIVFTFVKNAWEEYTEAKELADKSTKELKTLEEQFDKTQQLRDQNEMKLRSIKQIYQSNLYSGHGGGSCRDPFVYERREAGTDPRLYGAGI